MDMLITHSLPQNPRGNLPPLRIPLNVNMANMNRRRPKILVEMRLAKTPFPHRILLLKLLIGNRGDGMIRNRKDQINNRIMRNLCRKKPIAGAASLMMLVTRRRSQRQTPTENQARNKAAQMDMSPIFSRLDLIKTSARIRAYLLKMAFVMTCPDLMKTKSKAEGANIKTTDSTASNSNNAKHQPPATYQFFTPLFGILENTGTEVKEGFTICLSVLATVVAALTSSRLISIPAMAEWRLLPPVPHVQGWQDPPYGGEAEASMANFAVTAQLTLDSAFRQLPLYQVFDDSALHSSQPYAASAKTTGPRYLFLTCHPPQCTDSQRLVGVPVSASAARIRNKDDFKLPLCEDLYGRLIFRLYEHTVTFRDKLQRDVDLSAFIRKAKSILALINSEAYKAFKPAGLGSKLRLLWSDTVVKEHFAC
ncbi:hypothetical protein NM208_g5939 [Fusarium decemcellulare]|uniref:Uncharacterized protein n=1 Tax=Fusarium decemcellulare TaxID=57161 RepID=A0ACC1SF00_9HYPO|nr:hypothetical protein NM208_g5939 [Fusarium decemcellulare]